MCLVRLLLVLSFKIQYGQAYSFTTEAGADTGSLLEAITLAI
jgi:hypothetical protein